MSTHTTSAHPNVSSGWSSSRDSSHSPRRKNSVPRSTSNPISRMRISLLPPLPKKSWGQSYSNFQISKRSQCPHVHYHPWCDDCQTLMEWEQPLPIRMTCTTSTRTFGDLKMAMREKSLYLSLFKSPSISQRAIWKVCLTWREEQFAKAVTKRSAKMAAQEALHWSVHWQRAACGAVPPVI